MKKVNTFKAILKEDIQYQTQRGPVKIKKGEEIEVEVLKTPMTFVDANGAVGSDDIGSFIGKKNGERFDIQASEFKAFD